MREVQIGRQSLGPHTDCSDQIKTKQREVGQVIMGERLIAEVRMDEPDASQRPSTETESRQVGEHQLPPASHNHLLDGPASGDQEADLAPDFVG